MFRKAITASAAAGAIAALLSLSGGAVAASKKTHKVNVTARGGKTTNGGTVVKGIKATGTPFGKCTIKLVFDAPVATQTWRCKGGRFKGRYTANINGDTYTGSPKLFKGRGKFARISGTLSLKGSFSKGTARMTGKARY